MDLAEILAQAIANSSTLINQTAQRWPDRPIQVEFSWHPHMSKLDIVLRTVDHLPSWRYVKAAELKVDGADLNVRDGST